MGMDFQTEQPNRRNGMDGFAITYFNICTVDIFYFVIDYPNKTDLQLLEVQKAIKVVDHKKEITFIVILIGVVLMYLTRSKTDRISLGRIKNLKVQTIFLNIFGFTVGTGISLCFAWVLQIMYRHYLYDKDPFIAFFIFCLWGIIVIFLVKALQTLWNQNNVASDNGMTGRGTAMRGAETPRQSQ